MVTRCFVKTLKVDVMNCIYYNIYIIEKKEAKHVEAFIRIDSIFERGYTI